MFNRYGTDLTWNYEWWRTGLAAIWSNLLIVLHPVSSLLFFITMHGAEVNRYRDFGFPIVLIVAIIRQSPRDKLSQLSYVATITKKGDALIFLALGFVRFLKPRNVTVHNHLLGNLPAVQTQDTRFWSRFIFSHPSYHLNIQVQKNIYESALCVPKLLLASHIQTRSAYLKNYCLLRMVFLTILLRTHGIAFVSHLALIVAILI